MNLVTGGTGIVGSRLLFDLVSNGKEVRALKRPDSDTSSVWRYFGYLGAEHLFSKIEWIDGDITDIDSLEKAIENCTGVFHCAALVSMHKKDRAALYKTNVEGTANVVNAALYADVNKLCHVSSTAALGRQKAGENVDEKTSWKESPLNTYYAITKNRAEQEVWRGMEEGLSSVVVNPSIILGPSTSGRSSMAIFERVNRGLDFYTGGANGFVGVSDVSKACITLMDSDVEKERFILSAENKTYKEIIDIIAAELGKEKPTKLVQSWMLNSKRMIEGLGEFFGGPKAQLTRESAMNANNIVHYNGEKIKEFVDFEYQSIRDVISETCNFLKGQKIRV